MRHYAPSEAFISWLEQLKGFASEERQQFLDALHTINGSDGIRAFYARNYRELYETLCVDDLERFDALVGTWPERDMDFIPLAQAMCAATLCAAYIGEPNLTTGLRRVSAHTASTLTQQFAPYQAAYAATVHDIHGFIARSDWLISAVFNRGTATNAQSQSLGIELEFFDFSGAFFVQHLFAGGVPALFKAMGMDVIAIETEAVSPTHVHIRYSLSPIRT